MLLDVVQIYMKHFATDAIMSDAVLRARKGLLVGTVCALYKSMHYDMYVEQNCCNYKKFQAGGIKCPRVVV